MTVYIATGTVKTKYNPNRNSHVYYISAKDDDDAEIKLHHKVIESQVFGVLEFEVDVLRVMTDEEIITGLYYIP